MCFFLSSTCMTVIWNSTIIRTARKEDQDLASWSSRGSTFIHLPWSHVPWALLSLFLSWPTFYSFYIGFYNIFSLPFFKVCFHHFHSLLFNLSQKHKYTHTHTHTKVPIQALWLGAVWLGLSVFVHAIFHNITTCQERQPFSCLLLLLTHITLKYRAKGRVADRHWTL